MKIAPLVDANGRLFGRLNVVDMGVVTLIVVMGYGLFLASRVMSGELRRPPPVTAETTGPVVVQARVLLRRLDRELLKRISVGDSERDARNREVATIVQRGAPKPDFVDTVFGKISVEGTHATLLRLPVTMRLIGEARGGTFFFRGHLIGQGSAIAFQTPWYRVTGTVITALPLAGHALDVERESIFGPDGTK